MVFFHLMVRSSVGNSCGLEGSSWGTSRICELDIDSIVVMEEDIEDELCDFGVRGWRRGWMTELV